MTIEEQVATIGKTIKEKGQWHNRFVNMPISFLFYVYAFILVLFTIAYTVNWSPWIRNTSSFYMILIFTVFMVFIALNQASVNLTSNYAEFQSFLLKLIGLKYKYNKIFYGDIEKIIEVHTRASGWGRQSGTGIGFKIYTKDSKSFSTGRIATVSIGWNTAKAIGKFLSQKSGVELTIKNN